MDIATMKWYPHIYMYIGFICQAYSDNHSLSIVTHTEKEFYPGQKYLKTTLSYTWNQLWDMQTIGNPIS